MCTIFMLFFFISGISFAEPAQITIEWSYKDTKDLKMQIYHVDESKVRLWDTKNISSLNDTGLKDIIKDNTITIEPNRRKKFALVTYNNTDKPIYFFAAPHSTTPEELSLGLRFKCLCVNHAFKIEPKNYWMRVVELRLDSGYNAKKMRIKHTIIKIKKEKAENINHDQIPEEKH
ncbi:MAG: hypothetical protein J0M15_11300 [Deltaproteobacteria bacterium]|nr:hypothetical protein [Deltaproteobacteria bacterium]